MSLKYKKMEKDEECLICLDVCNDESYIYCKICSYKFHNICFSKWIKKCKELKNPIGHCLYCQNKKSIYKLKKFCCYYYSKKI